jgi:hypothetical protein
VLIGGATIATAPAAMASAVGCGDWGSTVNYQGLNVPVGRYCVNVNGSGNFVQSVIGDFVSSRNVCNWQMTAEFFNSHNQWYQTLTTATHYSCTLHGHDGIAVYNNKQTGYVCSTLRQNGARLASWCAAIHP